MSSVLEELLKRRQEEFVNNSRRENSNKSNVSDMLKSFFSKNLENVEELKNKRNKKLETYKSDATSKKQKLLDQTKVNNEKILKNINSSNIISSPKEQEWQNTQNYFKNNTNLPTKKEIEELEKNQKEVKLVDRGIGQSINALKDNTLKFAQDFDKATNVSGIASNIGLGIQDAGAKAISYADKLKRYVQTEIPSGILDFVATQVSKNDSEVLTPIKQNGEYLTVRDLKSYAEQYKSTDYSKYVQIKALADQYYQENRDTEISQMINELAKSKRNYEYEKDKEHNSGLLDWISDTWADNDKINNERQEKIQQNIDKSSNPVSAKLAELTSGMGTTALGAIGTAINPILGTTLFTASAGGGYYKDAKERGMNEGQAIGYSSIMAAMEGITEKFITGEMVSKFKKLATGKELSIKTLQSLGVNIGENFFQEALTEPISEITAYAIGGKDSANFNNMFNRMMSAGIDGLLSATLMAGAGVGISSAVNVFQKGNNATQSEKIQAFNDTVKSGKVDLNEIQKGVNTGLFEKAKNIKENKSYLENNQNVSSNQENIQSNNKTAQNQFSEQIGSIENNQKSLYNNTERESGIDGNEQRRNLEGNISQSRVFQNSKHEQEEQYRKWEKSIKAKTENELTYEERELKQKINKTEGKDIIFIKSDNNKGYNAGASLTSKNIIYINTEKAKEFGNMRTALHEVMESNIRFADDSTKDVLVSTISDIMNDKTFINQKVEFLKGQKDNPSDTAIAKDIICDRYAELQGEQLDYKNVLSDELNNRIDMSIEYFNSELKKSNNNSYKLPINLQNKYNNIDLNENISNMDGVPAIELNDGSIIPIKSQNTPHIAFIKNNNIDVNDIKSGGWISDGIYQPSYRSDTDRYVQQEKARQRIEEKKKNNILPTKDTQSIVNDNMSSYNNKQTWNNNIKENSESEKARKNDPMWRNNGRIQNKYRKFSQDFKTKGYTDLNNIKINNVEQLADIAQVFRNPSYETVRIIYTKNNVIVGQEATSSRIPGFSNLFPNKNGQMPNMVKEYYKMNDRMQRLGADGYYIAHNHPSGDAKVSQQDYNTTVKLKNKIPGFKGHLVVNSGTFAYIDENLNVTNNKTIENYSPDDIDNMMNYNPKFDNSKITNIDELGTLLYDIKNNPNYSNIFFADSKLKVTLLQDVPNSFFNMSKEQIEGYLRNQGKKNRASNVFIATENNTVFDKVQKLNNILDSILYEKTDESIVKKNIGENGNSLFDINNKYASYRVGENLETTYDNKKLTRKEIQTELLNDTEIIEENLDDANNLSMFNMNRTDPIRLQEKIFDTRIGKKINEMFFEKVKHNTAEKIRFLNKEREDIKSWDIKAKTKESEVLQKYAEKQYVNDQDQVVKYTEVDLKHDIQDETTRDKIRHAAKELRAKYDQYIDTVNRILVDLGYDPINKRNDYVRHFTEMNDVLTRFGIPGKFKDTLPTDINGITDTFRPGKNYFANAQQRVGVKTTYDAITGIDGYIESIGNLIYHTEDIQRLRAFDNYIRDIYGQKGFDHLDNLNEAETSKRIRKILDNHLSNYVSWLTEYTNNLAGKKSGIDRSVEKLLGRNIYSTLNTIKSQVGSNMTGFNVGSALTNFISVTQGASKTNKLALLKGTASTIQNIFHNDGFIDRSDFLTNRFGSHNLSSKLWQKISNTGQVFMSATDYFSSNVIVRSKYYENLAKGMSETQAIKSADDFGARILGDRAQGATANVFNSKMLGILTQFQLEVNNQIDSMYHDTKKDFKEVSKNNSKLKASMGAVWTLGQLAVYQYIFNNIFESIVGRRPAFDIIDIIKSAFGLDDDDDNKDSIKDNLQQAASKLIEALPFANLLSENARVPISSALPNPISLATGGSNIKDEASKLIYLLPPTGGSQLKKTIEGISTVAQGGSYVINSKGEKELRFPVENANLGDYIKAGLFGKYSLPLAKEYVNRNYKRLSAKQTELYEGSQLPYKELLSYIDSGANTVVDKINYVKNHDMTTEQKWGIYKYDLLSSKEREDGGSQLKDAEYIINSGVSKSDFMNIYNKAKLNDIDIPQEKNYKEMQKLGISLDSYIDYKISLKTQTNLKRESGQLKENENLKTEDKIKIILNSNYSTKEKWGICKYSILSDVERKDGTSQVDDAEYIIKNGVSESDYMKLYQKAVSNNIDMPTKKEYKKMTSSGVSLEHYIDYETKIKKETESKQNTGDLKKNQSLKDEDKIQLLLDSNYSNKEIKGIYENYIANSNDKEYAAIKSTNIDIKEYLKYKQQKFESDKKDDGTVDGKSISGSKKKKVYNYVNSMNINYNQKLLLLGRQYKLTNTERNKLAHYVNSLSLSKNEKLKIYEQIQGFTVYKNGTVKW